jgi:GMP synthase-like glutamine amidotransferase
MRINFLIHEAAEMPGAILNWAINRQHTVSYTLLYTNESLPAIDSFDALIIMGGPMNIYEEERFPWLKTEKEFIKEAIEKGRRVLGVCLGSQLIADILGAKVFRNNYSEIGWFPVSLTEDGAKSELLKGLDFSVPVLHWHGDTYAIPEGAVHLLKSEACSSQAFSYGDNVLALQFHIETTPESLEDIASLDRASLVKNRWVMTESEIHEGEKHIPAINKMLFKLLDRFFG